jgi:CheY-like chemotaxis protein
MLPYILLAEDDPMDRNLFVQDFEKQFVYAAVETVGDGQQLLDFLSACRWDKLPSMILIDYAMPCLGAPDLLRQLSGDVRYSDIPKCVWSTAELSDKLDECRRLGASTCFRKPSDPSEMVDLVRQVGGLLNAELGIA